MLTRRRFFPSTALSAGAILAAAAPVLHAGELDDDELAALLDRASTKQDYLKLAAYYAGRAKKLHKDASRHEAMTERYKRLPPRLEKIQQHMIHHCENLASSLQKAAGEADALASGHREMAKTAK